jgi:hypothetical protein
MTMTRGRLVTSGASVALALATVLAGSTFGPSDRSDWDGRDRAVDLTASALTSPGQPNVVDDVVSEGRAWPRRAKVDTTASAAADCDACSADASTLHVVYLDRPTEAVLANVGVAWSRCTACRATALSVQVVVLRSPLQVRADNRALAVNAACDRCRTTSVAYQLVVVGGRGDRLSRSAHRELEQWVADLAAQLRDTSDAAGTALRSDPTSPGVDALGELEQLVDGGLGGAETVQRDVDVDTGTGEPPVSAPSADPRAA